MYMHIFMCVHIWIVCHVRCGVHVHVYMIVSSTTQDGLSPLYVASQEGHTDIVDILLKHGADPNLACTVWGLVCSFHLLHVHCVLVHCPTSDRAAYSA